MIEIGESTNISKFICAGDCHYLERYAEGDTYLRKVEESKKKSSYAEKLINEIRVSKRFYRNRLDSEKKCLVLKKDN